MHIPIQTNLGNKVKWKIHRQEKQEARWSSAKTNRTQRLYSVSLMFSIIPSFQF